MLNISEPKQPNNRTEPTKQNNENAKSIADDAFLNTLYNYQSATWELILTYFGGMKIDTDSIKTMRHKTISLNPENIDEFTKVIKAKDEEINTLQAKTDMSTKEIERLKKELNEVKGDNKILSDANDILYSIIKFMERKAAEKEVADESRTLCEN